MRTVRPAPFSRVKQFLDQKGVYSAWVVIPALLLLCFASFGLMIPWLGFYWDDWPVLLTYRLFGPRGLWEFYAYDRPASAWTYIITLPILGYTPLAWQIFTLLLRWGTAVGAWLSLQAVWPRHKRETAWVAYLFVVYPVFTQQSISVAYSQHWLCYLLFAFSLAGMIIAARRAAQGKPRWFWALMIPSLAAQFLHMITMEYFIGLEFLRPVLLWLVYSDIAKKEASRQKSLRDRLVFIGKFWFPHLLVLVIILLWRFYFVTFPEEQANPPILLYEIFKQPVSGLIRLVQNSLQDLDYVLFSVWTDVLSPDQINLSDRIYVLSWIAGIVSAAVIIFLLARWRKTLLPADPQASTRWGYYALAVGVIALFLGVLPVWFTDRQIIRGTYSNRFALAGLLGASLILIGGLEWFTPRRMQKAVILAVLVCLAIASHLRTANEYRWSWINQTRFYWQLSWRAPYIQPQTAIFSDGEIFSYVGLYSTSAAINMIYPNLNPSTDLPYYFYSLGRSFAHQMPEFLNGLPLSDVSFRNYSSTGNTKQGIVILYDHEQNDCLHVLSPEDQSVPGLPEVTVQALPNSDLSRILPNAPVDYNVPTDIFGPEPEHGWCYLYQKAELARQLGNWQNVIALGNLADDQNYSMQNSSSNTPYEWLPFIEGYARTGRWDDARKIAADVLEKEISMQTRLCELWEKVDPQIKEPGCP